MPTRQLRVADNPLNASNRRITLIVQYVSKEPEGEEKGAGAEKTAEEKPSVGKEE